MSTHNYTRSFVNGGWDVDITALSKAVEQALPGERFVLRVNDTAVELAFDADLQAGDASTLDAAVAGYKASFDALPEAKAAKIAAIDERTAELIANGFVYASKPFSLSLPAQSKMIGTHQIKDHPALAYPLKWNTKDDDDAYELQDAAELDAFYLTGLATIRSYLDSGTALKDLVRAAATVADVNAVEDLR